MSQKNEDVVKSLRAAAKKKQESGKEWSDIALGAIGLGKNIKDTVEKIGNAHQAAFMNHVANMMEKGATFDQAIESATECFSPGI